MSMRVVGLFAVLAVTAACTTPIQTASGQPDFTVTNANPQCVRSTLLAGLVDGGYMVRSATDSQIAVGRPMLGNTPLGVFLAPTDERRSTFLMIPVGADVRIVMNEAFIANAGSGFESASPIYPTQEAQQALAAIGARVQAMCGGR